MKKYILLLILATYSLQANAHWINTIAKSLKKTASEVGLTKEAKIVNETHDIKNLNKKDVDLQNANISYLTARALAICAQKSNQSNSDAYCQSKKKEIFNCINENKINFIDELELEHYCGSKYSK